LPSNAAEIARRHNPDDWTRTLAYRDRAYLPFDLSGVPSAKPVLLDTTVYVDALSPWGLPDGIASLIRRNRVFHSSVACAELSTTFGYLDPAHQLTARNRGGLERALARIPTKDIRSPSPEAWIEAAVLAGILARIQGHAKAARRDLLLDALLFLNAIELGCVLVSRNIRHMDLLSQLRPQAQLLLYERT
jgi:hypothetical protein